MHIATRTVSAAFVRVAALGFVVLVLAVPAAGALPKGTLQIAPRGQGGVITVKPAGIDADTGTAAGSVCDQSSGDSSCTRLYDPGTEVTLTPSGSTFSRWSDPDCSGTGPCTVTVGTDPRTVVGTFTPLRLQVLVGQKSSGTDAKVTSTPDGVDCSDDCKTKFPAGTTITLHAVPNGHTFTRWAFGCTPSGMDCTVTLTDDPQPVGVSFDDVQPPGQPATIKVSFEVRKRGNGGGTVSGSGGILCPANCTRQYTFGTSLKLDAHADEGSVFTGWGGVCRQETSCTVPVGPLTAITATFEHDTTPPTAPGSLSVTSVSKSSVSIGWSASTDNVAVTEYATYLNGTAVGSTTDVAYTFANLACGTAYEVGVAALDRAGNRSPRTAITATTSPCAATVVTVTVTRVSVQGRRISIVMRVSRATRAHVTLTRAGRKVAARTFALRAGANTLALTAAPGTYRLTIGVDGASKVVTRTVVVKRR